MADLTISTIERARHDVAALRRGLGALSLWLEARRSAIPQTDEICAQIAQLGEFLERLNAGLEQQEKERAQLEGLFQVSRTINSTLELDLVLNHTMDVIIQVTRAERGFLMLADEKTGALSCPVARNLDRDTIAQPAFEVSRSIVERVAQTREPVITTDAQRDPRFSTQDSVISLSLRSILCHPLQVKDRVIGVVYVDNRLHIGRFQPSDLEALRAFTDQAAIAIDNAQLFASLRQKMQELSALKTFEDNIFASIPSAVIATDLHDRVTAFNRSAERIFGREVAEALGQPYAKVLAPLASTSLRRLVEAVKRIGARQVATEIQANVPGRGELYLSCGVSSLRGQDNAPQGVTIVVNDLTEKRKLEATREMFRRYLAPAVVDRLPSDPNQLRLGGKRQEITILFADIRGFTQFAEPLAPEELVYVLNQYLAVASAAILKYEGTLDKFVGDAVMALFNAPLPQPDHAERAGRAALEMRSQILNLHQRLPARLKLNYGIGIHTGEAVVGNVGTHELMNYTAIGDAVNLAKRLQENASGGQIIISDRAHARIGAAVRATKLPPLKVKGHQHAEIVWQLDGMSD